MADDAEVNVSQHGPDTIKGSVTVKGADGETWLDLPEGKPVAVCRCGQSGHTPFCDGTHNKAGFDSNPAPDSQPYPF